MNEFRTMGITTHPNEATTTGNLFAYWDSYYAVPTWQIAIGPESEADTLWAEAIAYDRENFPPVHIHVSSYGTGCDGTIGHDYITRPSDRDNLTEEDVRVYVEWQRADMLGTFDVDKFWRNAVRWAIDFAPEYGGKLDLQTGDDTYDRSASWYQRTDEGSRSVELRMCTDDCTDSHTVYDEYAQKAGY